ncbi:hypothetical protein FQN54_002372 [Arachnomyces sp. PD_36]|nr:hypothetical protein FQN54_002372 [Arachnomyces sp. PD_36]
MATALAQNTTLGSLGSESQEELLDVVDDLRSQGLSHFDIPLPQIVVCGDQSSGKSSVLEALSQVKFPTKDGLCTRFATEVILRKKETEAISVSIDPGNSRSPEEHDKLRGFRPTASNLEDFPSLVEMAQKAMDSSERSSDASTFSDDRLRVEISGPTLPQLTIVDLPGLIHSKTKEQTEADVQLVQHLVRGYMKNRRSIILAVVTAKNDISNQIVLKMANETDVDGSRTLGVITKPDTLHAGSDSERRFVDLAKNEDVSFRLGWHVLKNRDYDTKDTTSAQRDESEREFFNTGIWRNLPRDTVGIGALRKRLSKELLKHISKELPSLIQDIENEKKECQQRLTHLGESRGTLQEQRLFLTHISESFQSLIRAGIDGHYDHSFFDDSSTGSGYPRRLRAVVQNLNLDFEESTRKKGHRFEFTDTETETAGRTPRKGEPEAITREAYRVKVRDMMRKCRGRELPGLFDPLLVGRLFREQAEPWRGLAEKHVKEVWKSSRSVLEGILSTLADEKTNASLMSRIIDPFLGQTLTRLNKKLNYVLEPYEKLHAMTYNHYFTETIQNVRHERMRKSLIDQFRLAFGCRSDGIPYGATNMTVDKLVSTIAPPNIIDMEIYASSELSACMEAYYKAARKVMVDNVASMVIESCLVQSLPTLLTATNIIEMDDNLISAIASEAEGAQEERQLASQKLAALEKALEICGQHAGHQALGQSRKTDMDIANTETPLHYIYEESVVSDLSDAPNGLDDIPDPKYPTPAPEEPYEPAVVEHVSEAPQVEFERAPTPEPVEALQISLPKVRGKKKNRISSGLL